MPSPLQSALQSLQQTARREGITKLEDDIKNCLALGVPIDEVSRLVNETLDIYRPGQPLIRVVASPAQRLPGPIPCPSPYDTVDHTGTPRASRAAYDGIVRKPGLGLDSVSSKAEKASAVDGGDDKEARAAPKTTGTSGRKFTAAAKAKQALSADGAAEAATPGPSTSKKAGKAKQAAAAAAAYAEAPAPARGRVKGYVRHERPDGTVFYAYPDGSQRSRAAKKCTATTPAAASSADDKDAPAPAGSAGAGWKRKATEELPRAGPRAAPLMPAPNHPLHSRAATGEADVAMEEAPLVFPAAPDAAPASPEAQGGAQRAHDDDGEMVGDSSSSSQSDIPNDVPAVLAAALRTSPRKK